VLPSERDLESLFDLALDLLTIVGFDGYFKRVNPAFERVLGYSSEELLSRPYLDFYHPDDLQVSRDLFTNLLLEEGKEIIGSENRVICADGSIRWLEWNTRVVPHDRLMYCVARDVTDRRTAEAELREAHRLVEDSRDELRVLAEEQAALRRVATLVAAGRPAAELFAAVGDEISKVLDAPTHALERYDPDGWLTVIAAWGDSAFSAGTRWPLDGESLATAVYATQRPARIDDYSKLPGTLAAAVRAEGFVSIAGAPIVVRGKVWGLISAASRDGQLRSDTETRLAHFTELVATAISNTESQAEVTRLADEQSALRRVATLVAHGVQPAELFAAVSDEVGRLVGTDSATVMRYDDDGPAITFVGAASKLSDAYPVGARWEFEDGMASAEVYRTGRSARGGARDWSNLEGQVGETHHRLGIVSTVASPIIVEGRLWGVMAVQSQEPLPLDTDERLEKFTELLATAIANAESRAGLTRLADEQAALRRVATLVARGAPPAELFAAVSEEVGRLLRVDVANLSRYESDGTITALAAWNRTGNQFPPVGSRWPIAGKSITALVFATGRSARVDNYADASGALAVGLRETGVRSAVGTPIIVEGRLWGVMGAGSNLEQPMPMDTEARLSSFTELVATAIANAESREELTASRARVVAAADDTRRRLERDLHDGIQQRLVSLALRVRAAQTTPHLPTDIQAELSHLVDGLGSALEDLREISRGIHPPILAEGGLRPALRTLARGFPVPIELDLGVSERLPERVEVAAYYVASEALTNAVKHADVSIVELHADCRDGVLEMVIRDGGIGGADPSRGSGLIGLTDRVEALGGTISVVSPPGEGTSLHVRLPIT
jgi:PAS domain S-box-containing protein